MKTIAKFALFVICSISQLAGALSCGNAWTFRRGPGYDSSASVYGPPSVAAIIRSDEINESSGLVVSRCQPNVFWTNNDSGDGPFLYAFDRSGQSLGTWKVENADNRDWEDLSTFKTDSGQCFIYIAETGNTNDNDRTEQRIYRIEEPVVSSGDAASSRSDPRLTKPAEVLTFQYPDGRHDAESLIVHPKTEAMYVLTKQRTKPSGVYQIDGEFGPTPSVAKVRKIAEITVPAVPNGYLTGAAISPDGTRVAVCDYSAGYEFSLPSGDTNFDDIWSQKPTTIDLGERKQGESIAYSPDGAAIFATSEKKYPPLIELRQKHER